MKALPLLCLVLLIGGCPTGGDDDDDSAEPADDRVRKALVVGFDGARPDAVQLADTPTLDGLLGRAAWSFDATSQLQAVTSSGPGWTSILTGVDADKHGIVGNGDYDQRNPDYPTFLWRAWDGLGARAGLGTHWLDIYSGIVEQEAIADWTWATDQEVADWTVEAVGQGALDVIFAQLDDVDHAGHEFGFDPTNQDYLAAIALADQQLGQMVDATEARSADEEWLVVVTTDHGGEGNGHGALNEACQTVWLVIAGDAVVPGEIEPGTATHMDGHPTVLQFLGLDVDPGWGLDGVVRGLGE